MGGKERETAKHSYSCTQRQRNIVLLKRLWSKHVSVRSVTHLVLRLVFCVVLGHFLRRPLVVYQTATQQPGGQTSHEHPNVRDEHPDAIPCIRPNHTRTESKSRRAGLQSGIIGAFYLNSIQFAKMLSVNFIDTTNL